MFKKLPTVLVMITEGRTLRYYKKQSIHSLLVQTLKKSKKIKMVSATPSQIEVGKKGWTVKGKAISADYLLDLAQKKSEKSVQILKRAMRENIPTNVTPFFSKLCSDKLLTAKMLNYGKHELPLPPHIVTLPLGSDIFKEIKKIEKKYRYNIRGLAIKQRKGKKGIQYVDLSKKEALVLLSLSSSVAEFFGGDALAQEIPNNVLTFNNKYCEVKVYAMPDIVDGKLWKITSATPLLIEHPMKNLLEDFSKYKSFNCKIPKKFTWMHILKAATPKNAKKNSESITTQICQIISSLVYAAAVKEKSQCLQVSLQGFLVKYKGQILFRITEINGRPGMYRGKTFNYWIKDVVERVEEKAQEHYKKILEQVN